MKIEEADRPATTEEEGAYLRASYRAALEEISQILKMPGSPSLLDVPKAVEGLMRNYQRDVDQMTEEAAGLTARLKGAERARQGDVPSSSGDGDTYGHAREMSQEAHKILAGFAGTVGARLSVSNPGEERIYADFEREDGRMQLDLTGIDVEKNAARLKAEVMTWRDVCRDRQEASSRRLLSPAEAHAFPAEARRWSLVEGTPSVEVRYADGSFSKITVPSRIGFPCQQHPVVEGQRARLALGETKEEGWLFTCNCGHAQFATDNGILVLIPFDSTEDSVARVLSEACRLGQKQLRQTGEEAKE